MTHKNSLDRLQQTLEGMIVTQGAALATPLWNLDHEQIRLSLEAVATNREIITARIYDENGSLMLAVGEEYIVEDSTANNHILLQQEVVFDAGAGPKAIGKLEFVASTDDVWKQTQLRLLIAAGIALLAVTMEVAAALFALRRIVGVPLARLLSSINIAKSGSGTENIAWDSSDEMGQVISAFNDMQEQRAEYEQELRDGRDTLEMRVEERTKELVVATGQATRAQARLVAAIETISEGFSLYDSEDRLVICNTRYRELLRPNQEHAIEPGTRFKDIIRAAASEGLIADASGQIEQWIADRLESHRTPGEPQLQHRNDGRWILLSERKTEDGGTVAVYADITELKRREQELAEKSTALKQLSGQLAKYLSPQVYDSIFHGKQEVKVASSRKKLTVFFSDIADFTETADRLESEELTELLNHYLTEMSNIALRHGATIDKYVGDAIVIFFGDPETKGVAEDAQACVRMAISMRKRMLELETVWRDAGVHRPLRCRMGIHTDYCTVGNFGSDNRMDYTVIGGGVNAASRLEASAVPGEILVSYETYAQIKDEIHCEECGDIEVKGIAYPLTTYRVIDHYDNLNRDRHQFRGGGGQVSLDLDFDTMSPQDREDAARVLRMALEAVTNQSPTRKKD